MWRKRWKIEKKLQKVENFEQFSSVAEKEFWNSLCRTSLNFNKSIFVQKMRKSFSWKYPKKFTQLMKKGLWTFSCKLRRNYWMVKYRVVTSIPGLWLKSRGHVSGSSAHWLSVKNESPLQPVQKMRKLTLKKQESIGKVMNEENVWSSSNCKTKFLGDLKLKWKECYNDQKIENSVERTGEIWNRSSP